MKKVITYGTFDLFHHGHVKLLKRSRALGDHLTVALSSDEFNLGKGKKCYHSYVHREEILLAMRYVDEVIPENTWEQKVDDVCRLGINIFVMGDDWQGRFDFLKEHCEVVYLPRTPDVSTSLIKQELKSVEGASSGD
jgi:glycerol-3-phosphate cytidylyltransferase